MSEQHSVGAENELNGTEDKIFQLAKPYLTVRNNEAHTRSAITFALRLLGIVEGDRDIVLPAVILHDTGYGSMTEDLISRAWGPRKERDITRMHEKAGARIAATVLKDVGYDPLKTAEILQIIEGHDTRSVALSINDRIVKDADKLTRYAKDLVSWAPFFSSTPEEGAARLERYVDEWFFLPVSKEIARAELKQRRIEASQ